MPFFSRLREGGGGGGPYALVPSFRGEALCARDAGLRLAVACLNMMTVGM